MWRRRVTRTDIAAAARPAATAANSHGAIAGPTSSATGVVTASVTFCAGALLTLTPAPVVVGTAAALSPVPVKTDEDGHTELRGEVDAAGAVGGTTDAAGAVGDADGVPGAVGDADGVPGAVGDADGVPGAVATGGPVCATIGATVGDAA
jgi:hypothetical protein